LPKSNQKGVPSGPGGNGGREGLGSRGRPAGTCGRIRFKRRKVNLSQVFAGQGVGVPQVDEHIWLVTFMHYDLGYFDDETCRLEPIDNPFRTGCYPCLRNELSPMCPE
jgi:hypothetical protein